VRRLRLVFLARRLGVWRALPAPPPLCANRKLSDFCFSWRLWRRIPRDWPWAVRKPAMLREVRALAKLLRIAGGLRSIPRWMKEGWA
jgi:hypothetical protein